MMATPVVITWPGHGSFQLALPSGETLALDPSIDDNPAYPHGQEIHRCDAILISHGYFGTFPGLTGRPMDLARLAPSTKIMKLEPGKPVIR